MPNPRGLHSSTLTSPSWYTTSAVEPPAVIMTSKAALSSEQQKTSILGIVISLGKTAKSSAKVGQAYHLGTVYLYSSREAKHDLEMLPSSVGVLV